MILVEASYSNRYKNYDFFNLQDKERNRKMSETKITPKIFKEIIEEALQPINERLDAAEKKQAEKIEKRELENYGIAVGKTIENEESKTLYQAGYTEDYLSERKGVLNLQLDKAIRYGDKAQEKLLKSKLSNLD